VTTNPLDNVPHPSQVVVLVDSDANWATVTDLDGKPILADHVDNIEDQLIRRFFTIRETPYQEHPS
jgi:hypothetical protein